MLKRFVDELGFISLFFARTIKYVFDSPFRLYILFKQMEFAGIKSLSATVVSGIFMGMVVALGSYVGFAKFGAEEWLGSTVALAVCGQLAPVITAFVVSAKVGAAYAAEIGAMRITEQIDALEVMAINPINYLVVPRFLACLVMVPALTIFCDVSGVLAGYLISTKVLGIDPGVYMFNTVSVVDFSDILRGILRSITFGVLIPIISCYKGFYAQGGAEGVGRAVTETVVICIIVVLIDNYIFTCIFNYLVFWPF